MRKVNYNPEINLGHILTLITLLGGLVSGLWYISAKNTEMSTAINYNARRVDKMEVAIESIAKSQQDVSITIAQQRVLLEYMIKMEDKRNVK